MAQFTIFGLRLEFKWSVAAGFLIAALALLLAARLLLDMTWMLAAIAGFAAALLHYVGELLHQLGHALAARQTGYPMTGMRFDWLLAFSRYPEDEPPLPAEVHIRRAIGGPLASLAAAAVSGVLALLVRPGGGVLWWLVFFFFLDNLLVFTLGALLPLGFTDGSTLLKWWPQRGQHE